MPRGRPRRANALLRLSPRQRGVFAAASLACACAPSIELLVGARLIEGCGAALTMPLTIANLTSVLSDAQRGWAIGILATRRHCCHRGPESSPAVRYSA